jgi:hypothetical protein
MHWPNPETFLWHIQAGSSIAFQVRNLQAYIGCKDKDHAAARAKNPEALLFATIYAVLLPLPVS